MKKVLSIVAALVLSVTGISVARAGYIGDAYFPRGNGGILEQNDYQNNNNNVNPGGITDIVETEGDVAVDFNWIALIKEFDNLDPIDIYFDVYNSEGTTEYLFLEGVANSTGAPWTDYHLELGILDDDEFVSLNDLPGFDFGLDFDTPQKDPTPYSFFVTGLEPFTTEQIFSTVLHNDYDVSFFDGLIPVLGEDAEFEDLAWITFSIDVPDIDNFDFDQNNGDYQFVLRQYPTIAEEGGDGGEPVVPEPATMALLGSGLMGFVGLRRKRS